MFRAIISPIVTSTRLCLQLVVQSTEDAGCWWPWRGGTAPPHPCHQQAASSVLYTTSCKHSLVFLRMGEIIARNMLSWLKLLIKLLLLQLIGCLYYFINDARSHKHQSRHESFKLYLNYILAVYIQFYLLINTEDTVRWKVTCVIAVYLAGICGFGVEFSFLAVGVLSLAGYPGRGRPWRYESAAHQCPPLARRSSGYQKCLQSRSGTSQRKYWFVHGNIRGLTERHSNRKTAFFVALVNAA